MPVQLTYGPKPTNRNTLMSALHDAAYNADWSGLLNALNAGHPIEEVDQNGFTPLLWCCFRGAVGEQLPIATELLRSGANPNAATLAKDATCLILAVQSGNVQLVTLLAGNGADINQAADGVTPLMQAARDGSEAMVTALLNLGADPALSCEGFTAADYAIHGGRDKLGGLIRRVG